MTLKALVITSNVGVEHDELIQPLNYLNEKGIEAIHAAVKHAAVQTVKADKKVEAEVQPNAQLSSVNAEDYDVLVIPGGTVNADHLRIDEDALRLIQNFASHQKPIAAICHGPWALINAERIRDKTLTSYKSIRLDLENAGAHWVDEQVHRCNTGGWVLITSRCPDDLPAFNQAIQQELEQQQQQQQQQQ
ncbi:type 1 glutamine amidotransferase domain-containing protein [Acinetobacter sp. YH12057]|nr:type 1 glutamine amidotransferase domain-containing protein [Acinetobacter sp. YH12057]